MCPPESRGEVFRNLWKERMQQDGAMKVRFGGHMRRGTTTGNISQGFRRPDKERQSGESEQDRGNWEGRQEIREEKEEKGNK